MRDLRVANHFDWEDLSKYLAEDYFNKQSGIDNVILEPYGRNGQNQHGIDLYSKKYNYVVQCKNMANLNWNNILNELDKTKDYPHEIDFFLVTTTAKRDKYIQDKLINRYFHERPDGSSFEVDILYWDDVKSLNMVPKNVKYRIFPSLENNNTDHKNNLFELFKKTIPQYITAEDLSWLEKYDFSVGYIPTDKFNIFLNLYYEVSRAKKNVSLIKGNRYNLSKIYDIGIEFFDNLENFIKSVNNNIIGQEINGINVLWLDPDLFPKYQLNIIVENWKINSRCLTQSYREMVLDEVPFP